MIDFDRMREKSAAWGVSLRQEQLEQLDMYAKMLVDWNQRMNLTGITDSEGIMTRHFEDSMTMLHFIDVPENAKIIDVGTGAGFPGMVLKICRPDLHITLLDSLNKRLLFLDEVAAQLQLPVQTVHMRAEEGGRKPAFREQFTIACARAVANLRELSEYCLPYVKVGGQFVSMKGPDVSEEVHAAKAGIGTLGGHVASLHEFTISDGSGRSIIQIEKCRSTPPQFPRQAAKISKKPL